MNPKTFYDLAMEAIENNCPTLIDSCAKEMRVMAYNQNESEAKKTYKMIAHLYSITGRAQERFQDIMAIQEAIRATWTDEQKKDFTFRDPIFDALSLESFYIMTGGKDTLTISKEEIEQMAEAD